MDITFLEGTSKKKKVRFEEDSYQHIQSTTVGCNESGKPVDSLGRVLDSEPCPFGQRYSCFSNSCKYSTWFLFLMIGLPFLSFVILMIGIAILVRATKEKK
jgi:hypothetical protein